MIIPVKKTLHNAGHIDAKLIVFSEICQKNPAKSAVFYWLFLGEVSPWNRPIFLWICPWKSFEIWLFSAKMPRNRSIFLRILTFLPRNRRILPRILTFSRENPTKSANFSASFDFFPAKIPRNFAFFSAKYEKPCMGQRQCEQMSEHVQSVCSLLFWIVLRMSNYSHLAQILPIFLKNPKSRPTCYGIGEISILTFVLTFSNELFRLIWY